MLLTFDFRLVFFEYFFLNLNILSFMSASEICFFLISSVFVKYFLVSFVNLIPLLIRSFGIEFEPRSFSAQTHLTSELLRIL